MGYKKIVYLICFLFFGLSFMLRAQQTKGFEIFGHIAGVKNGEIVKLGNRFKDWHRCVWTDSCLIENGNFHLKENAVPEGPRLYEIWFADHRTLDTSKSYPANIGGNSITLFLNDGDIIRIQAGDINKMKRSDFTDEIGIEGSRSDLAKALLMPAYKNFYNCYEELDHRLNKIRDSVGFDRGLVQGLIEAKSVLLECLGKLLTDSGAGYKLAVPFIINEINATIAVSHFHAAFVAEEYRSLDEKAKRSYYGKLLKESAKLSIGQPFPDFALPNPDGTVIKASEFAAKNKLTIVHFWASNSYERESYQKELMILYKKYFDKGLGVIGISSDSVASDWKARIIVEQYPWVNVSDLKGNLSGGIINDIYHEGGHSIPNTTNVLLDSQGRIIAWDVEGVELQWYLWKYLGQ